METFLGGRFWGSMCVCFACLCVRVSVCFLFGEVRWSYFGGVSWGFFFWFCGLLMRRGCGVRQGGGRLSERFRGEGGGGGGKGLQSTPNISSSKLLP